MATTTKERALRKKYPKVVFEIAQNNFCCGIGEVGNFEEDQGDYSWWSHTRTKPVKEFATKEEQAEACYKEILEKNSPSGPEGAFAQVNISLVSKYKRRKKNVHQWPELEEILKREGWTEYSRFINPNHGNEVTLFGKTFPEYEKLAPDDVQD